MNGSYGGDANSQPNPSPPPSSSANYVVRLRGLPWNATQSEVENFLQGCTVKSVTFTTNEHGRSSGECFVAVESRDDIETAKAFDRKEMGSRYIEVFESSPDEMSQMMKKGGGSGAATPQDGASSSGGQTPSGENWNEPVVRLRGLPYAATKEDITKFFNGLDISQNGVHISSSKPAGEAFVAFANMESATKALELNRQNMGHRYIEVFKSTYGEARASIMSDSTFRNRPDGPAQGGPAMGRGGPMMGGGGGGGNYGPGNMGGGMQNQYGPQGGGFQRGDYNQGGPGNYGGPGPGQYGGQMNNSYMGGSPGMGNGPKRSMSVSFVIRMRGVPFEASEKEVFEFFNPVVPIRLEMENLPRGKPPVWYAEFGSREEANEAMTFHKKYMGSRYIELFSMWEGEGNRSKMIRT